MSWTDGDGENRRSDLESLQIGDPISFQNLDDPTDTRSGLITADSFSSSTYSRTTIYTNITSPQLEDGARYAFTSPALGGAKVPAADGDIIQYDSTSSKWRPSRIPVYDGVDGGTFGSG